VCVYIATTLVTHTHIPREHWRSRQEPTIPTKYTVQFHWESTKSTVNNEVSTVSPQQPLAFYSTTRTGVLQPCLSEKYSAGLATPWVMLVW